MLSLKKKKKKKKKEKRKKITEQNFGAATDLQMLLALNTVYVTMLFSTLLKKV